MIDYYVNRTEHLGICNSIQQLVCKHYLDTVSGPFWAALAKEREFKPVGNTIINK